MTNLPARLFGGTMIMSNTSIERRPRPAADRDARCPACDCAVYRQTGIYRRCSACGTIWAPSRRSYDYRDDYPADRGHFDAAIGRCKQITLASWVKRLGIPLAGRAVLEVGFGGGATLSWLAQQNAVVSGQEVVAANRAEAVMQGIPEARVKSALEDFRGKSFDIVLYLDAFEHILDPAAQLELLGSLTCKGSKALVVLPVADSMTRLLLRGFWPHDLPDHWVFYSARGLESLWRQSGWRQVDRFYPWKFISVATVARHLAIKSRVSIPTAGFGGLGFWLNFGERGFVFERS